MNDSGYFDNCLSASMIKTSSHNENREKNVDMKVEIKVLDNQY